MQASYGGSKSMAHLSVIAAVLAFASSVHAGERKVLTIAIDGLRPDALAAANTPHIDSLLDGSFFGTGGPSGIFAQYGQSEHLTFSGPGWGAYMTGLHVDRHGADTNEFENVVPGTTDWFTPLEAFNPSLDTRRVITWEIAHDSIPSGADIADVYEYNQNGDELMTNRVVDLMEDAATDVVMTFFSDVDGAGHTCGFDPSAACYLAEIADTDAQIGQIMSAMAARPTFANEDWLVILTTDHGGAPDGSHSGGTPEKRTIPFIVAGPLATTVLPQAHPRQVDVAATVLTYFGAPIPSNYDGHAVGLAPAGPAPATLGQNLVFNGDAEYGRGFSSNLTQQYAAGWDNPGPGGITQINYLAGDGFPTPTDPGPVERGESFFSGGTNDVSTMTQRIDVANLAAAITTGQVDFALSAWLGGYSSQNDSATVTARFLNSATSQIGSAQLAAVTATQRGNQTGLLFREQFGDLPSLTRYVDIVLTATRAVGENDGYSDNISLVLLIAGDYNQDGTVDASDYSVWRDTLGQTGSGRAADGNRDGFVNSADYDLWRANFGISVNSEVGAGTSVPEPAIGALATCVVLATLIARRYRL